MNLLRAMGVTPGGRVVEVGSGPGWVTEILLALGYEVDAVEPSEDMIAIAKERIAHARAHYHLGPLPRADFHVEPHVPEHADVLLSFIPVHRPPARPWVWRLAGNMRPGRTPPRNTICVSADHARRHGVASFVHNGVPPDEFRFEPRKGDHDLFLGRPIWLRRA